MAQLLVRGLDDDVKERLQRRAARHGRSMEAEARDILRDAVKLEVEPTGGLGTRISARFKSIGLKPHETIAEWRGSKIRNPFEE